LRISYNDVRARETHRPQREHNSSQHVPGVKSALRRFNPDFTPAISSPSGEWIRAGFIMKNIFHVDLPMAVAPLFFSNTISAPDWQPKYAFTETTVRGAVTECWT